MSTTDMYHYYCTQACRAWVEDDPETWRALFRREDLVGKQLEFALLGICMLLKSRPVRMSGLVESVIEVASLVPLERLQTRAHALLFLDMTRKAAKRLKAKGGSIAVLAGLAVGAKELAQRTLSDFLVQERFLRLVDEAMELFELDVVKRDFQDTFQRALAQAYAESSGLYLIGEEDALRIHFLRAYLGLFPLDSADISCPVLTAIFIDNDDELAQFLLRLLASETSPFLRIYMHLIRSAGFDSEYLAEMVRSNPLYLELVLAVCKLENVSGFEGAFLAGMHLEMSLRLQKTEAAGSLKPLLRALSNSIRCWLAGPIKNPLQEVWPGVIGGLEDLRPVRQDRKVKRVSGSGRILPTSVRIRFFILLRSPANYGQALCMHQDQDPTPVPTTSTYKSLPSPPLEASLYASSSKEMTIMMAESTLASPRSETVADLKTAKSKKKPGKKRRSQDLDRLVQEAETQNASGTQIPPKSLIAGRRLYCRVHPMLSPTQSEVGGITEVVMINDDFNPVVIHNEHFTGHAVFRVKNFRGVTPVDPEDGCALEPISGTEYFTGHRRTFSLQIAGRFRRPWSADEVMFGTFFQKPVHLPPFYGIAIAVAKKIDASMDGDLASDCPYMCSPAICAMNTARADPIIPSKLARIPERPDEPLYLPPWKFGGARKLEENFMATVSNWPEARLYRSTSTLETVEHDDLSDGLSSEADGEVKGEVSSGKTSRKSSFSGFFSRSKNDAGEKQLSAPTPNQRRSWFLKPENRLAYTYQPDTLYSFDFNNQYVDLNTMTLKLGISFDARHYLNDQPVVYQMRSRDGRVVFFTIELGLV